VSFLLDPPALYVAGETYARGAPESAQGRTAGLVGASVVAAFWAVSVSLWLDLPWVRWMWRATQARSGRDFMVGSGVVSAGRSHGVGACEHALAGLAFLLYPLWYWLGWDHGRRSRP
jgi:hypothetical protein